MLSNADITNILGIPKQTLHGWRQKDTNDWRQRIYFLVSNMEKEVVVKELELQDMAIRNSLEKRIARKEAELLSLRQLQMAS
jgi:hypothetical protein